MPTSLLALAIVLLLAAIVGLSMALAQNIADARREARTATRTPAVPAQRSHNSDVRSGARA